MRLQKFFNLIINLSFVHQNVSQNTVSRYQIIYDIQAEQAISISANGTIAMADFGVTTDFQQNAFELKIKLKTVGTGDVYSSNFAVSGCKLSDSKSLTGTVVTIFSVTEASCRNDPLALSSKFDDKNKSWQIKYSFSAGPYDPMVHNVLVCDVSVCDKEISLYNECNMIARVCGKCDVGYAVRMPDYACDCDRGYQGENCETCYPGYHKIESQCIPINICSCQNGEPVQGDKCYVDGLEECEKCNDGHSRFLASGSWSCGGRSPCQALYLHSKFGVIFRGPDPIADDADGLPITLTVPSNYEMHFFATIPALYSFVSKTRVNLISVENKMVGSVSAGISLKGVSSTDSISPILIETNNGVVFESVPFNVDPGTENDSYLRNYCFLIF